MSSLWINWRILWWRIQIGPDRPWVRLCWHCAVHDPCGCVFCDLDLERIEGGGTAVHQVELGQSVADGFQWVPCTNKRFQ